MWLDRRPREGRLSVVAGGGSTLDGMTPDDQVRARLLAAVIRMLPVGDTLRTGLEADGVTEDLLVLAFDRWCHLGGVGSDQDHHIAIALNTVLQRHDPALACRYLTECGCTDLVVILAATRTADEATEGPGLIGM